MISQSYLAQVLGLDLSTVKNLKRSGLPYLSGGKGRALSFSPVIALHWYGGYSVSRDRTQDMNERCRDLRGPVDPIAFSLSICRAMGDRIDIPSIQKELHQLDHGAAADALPERIGFFEGVLGK